MTPSLDALKGEMRRFDATVGSSEPLNWRGVERHRGVGRYHYSRRPQTTRKNTVYVTNAAFFALNVDLRRFDASKVG